jgi:hypothetical protein
MTVTEIAANCRTASRQAWKTRDEELLETSKVERNIDKKPAYGTPEVIAAKFISTDL